MAKKIKVPEERIKSILTDFSRAFAAKKTLLDEMQEDFEFKLGKQWDDKDVKALERRKVRALTINKIWPIVDLLVGYEAKNRSDVRIFPEGEEDSLVAEIGTRLAKNVAKRSDLNYKISESFGDGVTCGESWLEPWLDYTNDLVNGELKWRKIDYYNVFVDPSSREYDLSDAEYVDKVTLDLTTDQIISLYPESEDLIRGMKAGSNINVDEIGSIRNQMGLEIQEKGYSHDTGTSLDERNEPTFDLLEHYYKNYVTHFYVVDLKLGQWKEVDNEEMADKYVALANAEAGGQDVAKKIRRNIPEIWLCATVGQSKEILYEGRAWSYPKWKSYPLIAYWCFKANTRLDDGDRALLIQGMTRRLKDLNRDLNKRRTQELLHLNSTTNSGWLLEQGAWVNKDLVDKFGSTPGVSLEYKKGFNRPERVTPMPLSQGHSQLTQEINQDIRESTVNADLLAMQEGGQASGRAIALRQNQGMVMVQGMFDNLGKTKQILNRFILSQFGEIFTVDTAIKVVGSAFLKKNFSEPVLYQDPVTGQTVPQMDPTGEMVMRLNEQLVAEVFNQILNDAELGKYDVAVGETIASETIKYANYMMLSEMAQSGIAIPPDIIIDESLLNEGSKQKIKESYAKQQQMMAAQASQGGAPQGSRKGK